MPKQFDIDNMTVVKRQYLEALKQIGTLGGENHFIELQKSSDGYLWVMIHSGSRSLGKRVCDYYNEIAEKYVDKKYTDIQLAYLHIDNEFAQQYWDEMEYCITFAKANRKLMMSLLLSTHLILSVRKWTTATTC